MLVFRSSHQRCSVKKAFSERFTKLRGKHLCQSLLFNNVAGVRHATLLKKRLWHKCFPVNFVKFLRTPFCIEHFGDCFWVLNIYVLLGKEHDWLLSFKPFQANVSFILPWKAQKTSGFPTFLGGIKREHWSVIGKYIFPVIFAKLSFPIIWFLNSLFPLIIHP